MTAEQTDDARKVTGIGGPDISGTSRPIDYLAEFMSLTEFDCLGLR